MDLLIFVSVFFLAAVFLMPLIGFCYKLCETVYKRTLFAKGAKQIQLFSGVLLLLCAAALGADYVFKGSLFQANLLIQGNASLGMWQNTFFLLAGGSLVAAVFCFLAYKFSKNPLFFVFSAVTGIFLAVCVAKFMLMLAAAAAATHGYNAFSFYCLQLLIPVLALPADTFAANPVAVFSSIELFSAAALFFMVSAVFLLSLYIVCILSFLFRNAMDYGRDYYSFMLGRYGRAVFLLSLAVFVFGFVLLAGFALPFQKNMAEMLLNQTAEPYYWQWALLVAPLIYFLVSLKLKKNFYSAQIPMQKKSSLISTFIFDFAFVSCIIFFIILCPNF